MSFFYQPHELSRSRILVAIAGLAILSSALWLPKESFLHGLGGLIGFPIGLGAKNPKSTMTTALTSLFAAVCFMTGGFLVKYAHTWSQVLSFASVGLALYLTVFHLDYYLHRNKAHHAHS